MTMLESFEYGEGPLVLLCHGAASHAGQWRALIKDLEHEYRLIAFNQYGYGASPPWRETWRMRLEDQAEPIAELMKARGEPLHIVGHSHGATIAALIATYIPNQVRSLSLYEPNTFCALDPVVDREAYQATCASFKSFDLYPPDPSKFPEFAEVLLDYWLGQGAWNTLSDRLKAQLIEGMEPTLNEVNSVITGSFPIEELRQFGPKTLLMFDPNTPPSALQVVKRYHSVLDGCVIHTFPNLGHLAPAQHPLDVNPVIIEHINRLNGLS